MLTVDKPSYAAFSDGTLRFYKGNQEVISLHLKPVEARELASLLLSMSRKDTS